MQQLKIYLETTIFNYYFDTDREAHPDTVKLFKEIASGKYEAFTSLYVTDELEAAPVAKRDKMIRLIAEYGVTVLAPNKAAEQLADTYVAEGMIPVKYRMDAIHIAVASVNGLDMIVSTNFKHIVKRKTVRMTSAINVLNGYRAVEILSPMEVVEND